MASINGTFDITVNYTGDSIYQPVFDKAAQIWSQIITADIPDVNSPTYGFIDDLLIDASVVTIDGPGNILGQAGPDEFLRASGLPDHGVMEFDVADVASMYSSGMLLDVILHEMGHILGIGTLWTLKGVKSGFNYIGAAAVAEYRTLTGNGSATSVPIESGGGAGTAGSHWSEAVFDAELMTGYIDGSFNPISRVTIASLKDLGYTVDIGAADPYALPGHVATDDFSGTARTTGQITVNATAQIGTIEVAGDHDWFRVQLSAGTTYTVSETGAPSGAGTLSDPWLRLYDSAGHLLAQNDDFGGSHDSQLSFSPSASGTYYVGAGAHNDAFTGTYRVSVATSMPAPPETPTSPPQTPGPTTQSVPLSVQVAGTTDLGTFNAAWKVAGVGDFNGDGNSDILWRNPVTGHTDEWQLANGQWSKSLSLGSLDPAWDVAGIGDFNGDGNSDVLWRNPTTGQMGAWLLKDGQWSQSVALGARGTDWQVAGIGDFNGDGTDDILWRNSTTGQVDEWRMSNGNWGGSLLLGSRDTHWVVAGIGDFNNDGQEDVLWRNPTTGQMEEWKLVNGQWAGSFALPDYSPGWQVAAVSDFNGDGSADVLWRNPVSGQLDGWLMQNMQFTAPFAPGTMNPAYSVAGSGDFNHSGSDDILWRNAATGQTNDWLLTHG
jgi:hypothetical protein